MPQYLGTFYFHLQKSQLCFRATIFPKFKVPTIIYDVAMAFIIRGMFSLLDVYGKKMPNLFNGTKKKKTITRRFIIF